MMKNNSLGSWVPSGDVLTAEWVDVSSRERLNVFEVLCALTCPLINHQGHVSIDKILVMKLIYWVMKQFKEDLDNSRKIRHKSNKTQLT